jgi:hypothetical protein
VIGSEKKPGKLGFFYFDMSSGATVYHLKLEHFWNIFFAATLMGHVGTPPVLGFRLGM